MIETHYTDAILVVSGKAEVHELAIDFNRLHAYPAEYEHGSALPVSPAEPKSIEIVAVRLSLGEDKAIGFYEHLSEGQLDAISAEILEG